MQKIFIILLVIATPVITCSQVVKSGLRYFNITQAGLLQGQNQHTYSIQTINGVTYKKYNAGIGIALDNYGLKSLPVFADLRYSLVTKKKSTWQVYADAGLNIPLHNDGLPAKKPNGTPWNTMHNSFYGEAGFSYSIALVRRFSLIAGAGYNYKTFKYTETVYTGDISFPERNTDYTYHYSKFVIRLGFGF